jgi:VIT1/CCC1 family predicted Fe2+/Mn2+ transporter
MTEANITPALRQDILSLQQDEINGCHTYRRLAKSIRDPHNREIVEQIAEDEQQHYESLKKYTEQELSPNRLQINLYYALSRLLGLSFGIRLMERAEEDAQEAYARISHAVPEIHEIIRDEEQHEAELLDLLDEESLQYAGSVVLGLNDALVELTGTLAGLTFAFQNTNLIALSGLITGIAASFSMGASEYLSARAGEDEEEPLKSALYTGGAYIFTVFILILPYLVLENYLLCLAWTLVNAIAVIAIFNFYLAVAKGLSFRRRFFEMAGISLGVSLFSFGVGYVIRQVFGIEV